MIQDRQYTACRKLFDALRKFGKSTHQAFIEAIVLTSDSRYTWALKHKPEMVNRWLQMRSKSA